LPQLSLSFSSFLFLLFSFFFFHSSGPHRDLHSFPTRRSSDLRLAGAARPNVRKWEMISVALRTCSIACSSSRTARLLYAMEQVRDRKSTRLNSSHVSISYAVFCLKKKKKKKKKNNSIKKRENY